MCCVNHILLGRPVTPVPHSGAVGHAQAANVLLALGLRGVEGRGAAAAAAAEVSRGAARKLLLPLLDHAVLRLAAVLRATWQVCLEHCALQGTPPSCAAMGSLVVRYTLHFNCHTRPAAPNLASYVSEASHCRESRKTMPLPRCCA